MVRVSRGLLRQYETVSAADKLNSILFNDIPVIIFEFDFKFNRLNILNGFSVAIQ